MSIENKKIATVGSGGAGRAAVLESLLKKHVSVGGVENRLIGSTMEDYYEFRNTVRDIPLVYDDGKHHRNESKHKETCAKNRAKRKRKKKR